MFTDDERFLDAHRFDGDRGSSGIVMPGGASAYLTAQDGRVHPYDLDGGEFGEPIPAVGDGDPFPVLAASPDGGRLIVAARSDPADGPSTVGLVETATGDLVFPPAAVNGSVTSAAFLPGGRIALALGEAGEVVILDGTSGAEVARVAEVEVPPDDVIWTLDPAGAGTGRVLRRPSSVAVAGDELLVGAADGSLRVLDAQTLDVRRTFDRPEETVSALWPLADGTVVTSGRYGLARLDLTTGVVRWERPEFGRCINLTVLEARGLLFCGDPYGRLEERDLASAAVLRRLDAQNGSSGSLWLANGGAELVSFGRDEPVVSRWRLDGSGPITRVVAPGWSPIDFDASGDLLLLEPGDTLASEHPAAVVNAADGTIIAELDGPLFPGWSGPGSLFGIGVSPAGALEFARAELAAGRPTGELAYSGAVVERPGEIMDLDVDTGKERMLFRYRTTVGNALATLDLATVTYGPTIEVDGLVSYAVSRTGDRVVAGTTKGVVVYDGNTGEVLGSIDDPDLRAVVVTVADQLFVGSLGGELTQYDLETLEPIRTFGGSRGHAFGGAGTADGSLFTVSGGDRVAAVYDVASGVQLGGPITIAPDERSSVRMSPDGRWLAVGGQAWSFDDVVERDGTEPQGAKIWDLDPTSWIRAACGVAGRNLTRDEWAAHIGDLAPYHPTCPA